MQSTSTRPRRSAPELPSLTGTRAVAAFAVFGLHFLFLQFGTPLGGAEPGGVDRALAFVFTDTGRLAVGFFFVLSGFVLTWATPTNLPATEFWLRRGSKIYPVSIVTALIALVLFGVVNGMWTDWRVIASNLLLLQAWSPDQAHFLGLNPVLWSLSCEAFFYLMFPAVILVLARASNRRLWLTVAGCVAVAALLPRIVHDTFTLAQPEPAVVAPLEGFPNAFSYWFTVYFPLMRLPEFVFGMAIALLFRRGVRVPSSLALAAVVLVGGLVVNAVLPFWYQVSAFMMIPFGLVIAAFAQADLRERWNPMRSRAMVFGGEISFCLYAVHVLFVLFTVVPTPAGIQNRPRLWLAEAGLIDPTAALPAWGVIAMFLGYLLAAGIAAWLLHITVELPATRYLRRLPRRGAANADPQPEPQAAAMDSTVGAAGSPLEVSGATR